jgi:hypothetical protein
MLLILDPNPMGKIAVDNLGGEPLYVMQMNGSVELKSKDSNKPSRLYNQAQREGFPTAIE